MAIYDGDIQDLLKGGKRRRIGGYFYKTDKYGRVIIQKKPRWHPPSIVEQAWSLDFGCLARHTKAPWSGDFNEATSMSDQSGWYYRDVLHSALTGTLMVAPEKRVTTPTARVFRVGNESLTNGVVKILTPTDIDWDNNVFWNPTANQSRLTVRSSGVYLVGCQVEFTNISGGRRAAQLILNGTKIIGDQTVTHGSANLARLTPATLWAFNDLDYVEVGAFANVAGVACELENFWILAITPEAVIT